MTIKKTLTNAVKWVGNEAWEKINIVGTWHELKELGLKHGKRFFCVALVWELVEDVLFPYISWKMGVPELIPFFLIMHFEPLVYPAFFWFFRMYDRSRGLEPWEPDRQAQSSYWRSAGKVAMYNLASAGWLAAILMSLQRSPKIIAVYVALMIAFGFIHERIWHDSNFGINDADVVHVKRTISKTLTYSIVSTTILGSLLRVSFGTISWHVLFVCQVISLMLYMTFEGIWSRSSWGLAPVSRPPAAPQIA